MPPEDEFLVADDDRYPAGRFEREIADLLSVANHLSGGLWPNGVSGPEGIQRPSFSVVVSEVGARVHSVPVAEDR